MKTFFAWVLAITAFVALAGVLFAVSFGSKHLDLWWTEYFGTKEENVKREVYESTRSYNAGMESNLARLMRQYRTAKTQEDRDAIASATRSQFSGYDMSELDNPDLKKFWQEINSYE